jgi:hypothetical protein
MKLIVALFTSILALGPVSRAASMPSTAPQWHTLATEAYPNPSSSRNGQKGRLTRSESA